MCENCKNAESVTPVQFDKILISYSGSMIVPVKDLKVQSIEDIGNDSIENVDTSNMSVEEIVAKLNSGDFILTSFGLTYAEDAIDGYDDFTFSVDED